MEAGFANDSWSKAFLSHLSFKIYKEILQDIAVAVK